MWFIEKFERGKLYPASPTYHNIPILLQISGAVDADKMQQALKALLAKHDVLRTKVVDQGEKACQEIVPIDRIDPRLTYRKLRIAAGAAAGERRHQGIRFALRVARMAHVPAWSASRIFDRKMRCRAIARPECKQNPYTPTQREQRARARAVSKRRHTR